MTRSAALLLAFGLLSVAPTLAQTPLPTGPKAPAPAAPAAPAGKPIEKPSVERINAYFNKIGTMTANFEQTGSDGRRFAGTLYLARPGKMRFEYDPPAQLEIVADGRSVAIRDRKVNTQDLYLIGQTPLKFLLADKIDIARDSKLMGIAVEAQNVVVTLEDKSTLGGTSRIRLQFDGRDLALRQWTVTDPQGFDTTVRLSNIDFGQKLDPKYFYIEYATAVGRN